MTTLFETSGSYTVQAYTQFELVSNWDAALRIRHNDQDVELTLWSF